MPPDEPHGARAVVYAAANVDVAAMRDDAVLQSSEDAKFPVRVFHTWNACPGSATAYVLRRIAYRAGAYAPGIHEHMFHELNTSREGGTIEKVQRWFAHRVSELHLLGYRLQCRRVATPTHAILDWVKAGRGHRGAMLPTSYTRLHPEPGTAGQDVPDEALLGHAVGVVYDRLDDKANDELLMIDPWPGVVGGAHDRGKLPPTLEAAHKDRGLHALVYFWVGWS